MMLTWRLTRLWLCVALTGLRLVCGEAWAQWDAPVSLSHDSLYHKSPQFVVDDSLHLHAFDVRSLTAASDQPASLFYQRFDSWGNPLSEPLELLPNPGPNHYDYQPGVFLDRSQHLHVVWGQANAIPPFPCFYYARMSTSGEFLTAPTSIAPADWPSYFVMSGINMVETEAGEIWIAAGSYTMVVNEEGQILQPMQTILAQWTWTDVPLLQADQAGHVWACVRYFGPPAFHQNISVIRLDTASRVAETVTGADSGQVVQMTPEAFRIDTIGAFHYVLYRDDAGLFYQRDGRDGSPSDTVVFDPSPYGLGSTWFALAVDTLEYIWGQTLPAPGFLRVGFTLDGQRVLGPLFTTAEINFMPKDDNCFAWKHGSYWVLGLRRGDLYNHAQLGMIHVPGEYELAYNGRQRGTSRHGNSLGIYPQPAQEHFTVSLPDGACRIVGLALYNVLGQQIINYTPKGGEPYSVQVKMPPALPAGRYYISVKTNSKTFVSPIMHIP